jgi:hypothetical protein
MAHRPCRISFDISRELKRRAKLIAIHEDITLSNLVRSWIETACDRAEKQAQRKARTETAARAPVSEGEMTAA